MMRKNIILILILFAIATSCNKQTFNKILKSDNYELMYSEAKRYYEAEKYQRAIQLLDQLMPHERGKARGEEVMFLYAMANYKIRDYIIAGYYFDVFNKTYPISEYSEEAMFLGAYCYYLDSPKSSLDQTPTLQAIKEFEIFLNKHGAGDKTDTTNLLIDELRYKLQEKSYNIAKLYYDLGYYNAASIAFENSINDFPDSPYKEEILFYNLKALYIYANNSIDIKRLERYNIVLKKYKTYIKNFPTGKFVKEANKISEETKNKVQNIKSKK